MWQTLSGECLHVLSGHTQACPAAAPPLSCPARQARREACRPAARQGVNDVAWDPSDRYLATASDDRTLILWGAAAGERLRTLEGHTNFVFCCAFNPRQSSLARAPAPPGPARVPLPQRSPGPGRQRARGRQVSGSFDETVRVGETRPGKEMKARPRARAAARAAPCRGAFCASSGAADATGGAGLPMNASLRPSG